MMPWKAAGTSLGTGKEQLLAPIWTRLAVMGPAERGVLRGARRSRGA